MCFLMAYTTLMYGSNQNQNICKLRTEHTTVQVSLKSYFTFHIRHIAQGYWKEYIQAAVIRARGCIKISSTAKTQE